MEQKLHGVTAIGNIPKHPGGCAVLSLPARQGEFPRLHSFLESWAAGIQLPEHPKEQLLIAADEIFANIAAYAYQPGDGEVRIEAACNFSGRYVTLTFTDRGVPFDPLSGADPDIAAPLAERRIGGLGIFVVKKLMDKVEYRRENGCNILTLTKRFGSGEDAPCG